MAKICIQFPPPPPPVFTAYFSASVVLSATRCGVPGAASQLRMLESFQRTLFFSFSPFSPPSPSPPQDGASVASHLCEHSLWEGHLSLILGQKEDVCVRCTIVWDISCCCPLCYLCLPLHLVKDGGKTRFLYMESNKSRLPPPLAKSSWDWGRDNPRFAWNRREAICIYSNSFFWDLCEWGTVGLRFFYVVLWVQQVLLGHLLFLPRRRTK